MAWRVIFAASLDALVAGGGALMEPRRGLKEAEFVKLGTWDVSDGLSGLLVLRPKPGGGVTEARFATTVRAGLAIDESKKQFDGNAAGFCLMPKQKLLEADPESGAGFAAMASVAATSLSLTFAPVAGLAGLRASSGKTTLRKIAFHSWTSLC